MKYKLSEDTKKRHPVLQQIVDGCEEAYSYTQKQELSELSRALFYAITVIKDTVKKTEELYKERGKVEVEQVEVLHVTMGDLGVFLLASVDERFLGRDQRYKMPEIKTMLSSFVFNVFLYALSDEVQQKFQDKADELAKSPNNNIKIEKYEAE